MPLLTDVQMRDFVHRFGDSASLAVAPLDGGPRSAVVGRGEPFAWSTVKVLIAAAVVDTYGGPQGLSMLQRGRIREALAVSDNAAAAWLHADLVDRHGGVDAAAGAMNALLRAAGDATTVVQTRPRGQFSSYGQTLWGVGEQAQFAASLYRGCVCDEQSTAFLLDEMSHVSPDQRWGVGSIDAKAFKGGWGPDPGGAYLVRQFGYVMAADGNPYAVAIAARTADGSFASGTRTLSEIAVWLQSAVPVAPPALPCGGASPP